MPRPKATGADEVARWAAAYRERHGIPADPFVIPRWRRLPDCVDVSAFAGHPGVAGFRFLAGGRWEPVYR